MNPGSESIDLMIPDLGLTRKILRMATDRGADLIGISDPDVFADPSYEGRDPRLIDPAIRAVILLGVMIPKGAVGPIPSGRAEYTNTLMAGTATLRVMAYSIARDLERAGYSASIAPSEGSEFGYWYADKKDLVADFSMKYAAYTAGLGSFGRNHLFLSDEFGPRVRFTAILTDACLEPGTRSRPFLHPSCSDCTRCIDICPVRAISLDGTLSRQRCAEYMFNTLGGLRCGLCIQACPLSGISKKENNWFRKKPHQKNPDLLPGTTAEEKSGQNMV